MKVIAVGAAVILSLVGCADDGTATDPQDPSGAWTYTATDLVGGDFVCAIRDVSLTLTVQGGSLSGTTSGGTLTCAVDGNSSEPVSLGTGTVTGTVSGETVAFDVTQGANQARNQGRLSGGSLSGATNASFDFGPQFGVVELAGPFRADRR